MKLQTGLILGLAVVFLPSCALAQDTHDGFIWIEGPSEVLESNTTYTLEVWGRIESPLWDLGNSGFAGFSVGVPLVEGVVSSFSNVVFPDWSIGFSGVGNVTDTGIEYASGGQLNNCTFWLNPYFETSNPNLLFSFDITTTDDISAPITIGLTGDNPNGVFSFWLASDECDLINIPMDADTSLSLEGWSSTIPAPATLAALGLGAGCLLVQRRRKGTL